MKTACFIATVLALGVAAVHADEPVAKSQPCDTSAILAKVYPVLFDATYNTCQNDGGYQFHQIGAMPTPDQIAKMCASPACQDVLKKIVALDLPACSIADVTGNLRDTVNAYADQCIPKA